MKSRRMPRLLGGSKARKCFLSFSLATLALIESALAWDALPYLHCNGKCTVYAINFNYYNSASNDWNPSNVRPAELLPAKQSGKREFCWIVREIHWPIVHL